ncbi:spore resistance protein CotO [Priestia megaterium]|uniref:CotO family spore coat protein n=1 Tax=Priestia megaterium TaxID=1404 RepID=UPI000E126364|nr:CotO family spore coat protein [Priestia megaterium]SUV01075.1 spore resistance protein CotO [Priestia megaterium]
MTNSKSKSEENEPLMYIVQPNATQNQRSMQYYFSSKQEDNKGIEKDPVLKEEPSFSSIQEVKEPDVEKVEEIKQEKEEERSIVSLDIPQSESKKPNKMFQSMTIKEKIEFLCSFPAHMSQPICEITCQNQKYIGTILELKEGSLYVSVPPNKEKTVLAFSDIQTISIVKI